MVRSTAITIQIMGISISITHLIILLPPFLNHAGELLATVDRNAICRCLVQQDYVPTPAFACSGRDFGPCALMGESNNCFLHYRREPTLATGNFARVHGQEISINGSLVPKLRPNGASAK
jgi:hypothetical protein